jgi:hypothetical protein
MRGLFGRHPNIMKTLASIRRPHGSRLLVPALVFAATVLSACGGGGGGGTSSDPTPSAPAPATPTPTAYFASGDLIVSRTAYTGVAATVQVGQALPGGGTAVNDGTFPGVFKNETPDPSFGVTSPILLDELKTDGTLVRSTSVDTTKIVSSFASKSELALNVSTDKTAVTFMGYASTPNVLDVSNANTPGVIDATNPVQSVVQRVVANVNLQTGALATTNVNAYSGNNGRAVVLAGSNYYMVGNAGNGSGNGATLSTLSDNTGVQMIASGGSGATTAVGTVLGTSGSTTGYQRGFTLQGLADPQHAGQFYAADKTGKDDNFRGLTIFNNTLFVTKGSGSNGVNTVYQVGAAGALANGGVISNAAITILPGFNSISEKVAEAAATLTATPHPFGVWFADANTLYVADEGDGNLIGASAKVTTFAGLAQYKYNAASSTWQLAQTFQGGLLDQAASQPGSLSWHVHTDGLRNLAGKVNSDGTVTLYATTSTVSDDGTHDLGADPNQLVTVTIGASSTSANTRFSVLKQANPGERFGGVAIAP